MSDVTVTLNNTEIATLDDTGIARLKTSGKRMDGDVLVKYEKPQAGVAVEPLPVTANGTYTAPAGKAYSPVTVTVPTPETQTRTAIPSLSTQSITPDSGKLLSAVTVNPITASLLASLDPDFAAENIADGVDLFGMVGTHSGSGGGTTIQTASGTLTTFDGAAHTLPGLTFLPDIISFNLPNNYYTIQNNMEDETSNFLPSMAIDLTRLSTNARSQNNWVSAYIDFANPQDRDVWCYMYLEITINNGAVEYTAMLINDEEQVVQSLPFLPSGSFAWQAWELGLRG